MKAFYDSNVFLKFLGGDREAEELIDSVFEGTVEGVINWVVLSEVTFGYLKLATNLRPYDLKKKLSKIDVDFNPVRELVEPFKVLEASYTPDELFSTIRAFGLLPNDALIALTCQREKIPLVSFDSDFDSVPDLRRITNFKELLGG